MPAPCKLFISYSHDSAPHRAAVLSLANRLRQDGLDCMIDQYVNGFPAEGWQRWMETQIEQADFVLVVCTALYLKRYRGLDEDGGRGVTFEGVVISQTLYDAYYRNTKFVPVLPDDGDFEQVPLALKGFGAFRMGADYEGLYRYLTGQAVVVAPELGERVVLGEDSQPNPSFSEGEKHPHPNPSPSEGEGLKNEHQIQHSQTGLQAFFFSMPWRNWPVIACASSLFKPNSWAICWLDRFSDIRYRHNIHTFSGW
ncbi:MAG: toll/interleukin-1 receptor domain-containing protein [Thiolinea sp.]